MLRKELIEKLVVLLPTAIQGGLSQTTRTCGIVSCACHKDPAKRHGPHLYLTFKTKDKRSSAMYIPREFEKDIRLAVSDWAKLWDILVSISELNRQEKHQTMRKRPPRAKKKASK